MTQGTFDGVHKAHQVILNRLKELARRIEGETVVLTFDPHPRMVLFPDDHGLKLLTTTDEKIELLRENGLDNLIIIPFTKDFSRLSSLQFIRDIIVDKIGTKMLVIGYNHRFGKNRSGTFEDLKEYANLYDFQVEEIPEQDVDEVSVSSTRVRDALHHGDVAAAMRNLGRYYSLHGTVIEGMKLGKQLGYPTANLQVGDPNKLIPADGIYAVTVAVNKQVKTGMLSIGNNPTVPGKSRSIEVHIFDFDESIYGQEISIGFVEHMRDEKKFDGLELLKAQLKQDEIHARNILHTVSKEA